MNHYLDSVVGATGLQRATSRFASILGADAPASVSLVPAQQRSFKDYLRSMTAQVEPDIKDGVGTVVGAAAGAILYKKHRYLGGLVGASIGRNGLSLAHPADRRIAMCNMGITGAGVAGSLMMPKHPVWGFILGWLAGNVTVTAGKLR